MSTKLTKKDKTLLYIMAVVLVAFGFVWFIIFPQMDLSGSLDSQINDLEAKKLPVEAAVLSVESMKGIYEENAGKLDKVLETFYPHMENYEIDKLFTTLLVDGYGLTVTNFDMSAIPTGVMVQGYMAGAGEENGEDSSEGENSESGEMDAQLIPVVTSAIFITATGDKASAQALVDDIFNNYPSIHVAGYSISDDGSLTLSCDLYMRAA